MIHRDWPSVYREIHFSGGIKGINNHQDDVIYLKPDLKSNIIKENINDYSAITSIAEKYNLLIIGINYFHDENQMLGIYPPEWVPFRYDKSYQNTIHRMANIRNSAYSKKDYEFVYCLRKIEEWTKASARALMNISVSYNKVLSSRCIQNNYKTNEAFDDMNCDFIYDSLHNSLYYMAILRDHLAEFIAKHIIIDVDDKFKKLNKMSTLKNNLETKNISRNYDDIKNIILKGYDIHNNSRIIPGWLQYLKEYRNAITHDRPINMINTRILAYQLLINVDQHILPKLKFPIPEIPLDKEELYNYQYIEEKIKYFPSSDLVEKTPDGLEVCFRLFLELMNFLDSILELSPYKPQPIRIDSTNAFNFQIKSTL